MNGKKNKSKGLRKSFVKDHISYAQVKKFRNIAIYHLVNNKNHTHLGYQVFVIKSTGFSYEDPANKGVVIPESEIYDFDTPIIPTYTNAHDIYMKILDEVYKTVRKPDKPRFGKNTRC